MRLSPEVAQTQRWPPAMPSVSHFNTSYAGERRVYNLSRCRSTCDQSNMNHDSSTRKAAATILLNTLLGGAVGKMAAPRYVDVSWLPFIAGCVIGFFLSPVVLMATKKSPLGPSMTWLALVMLPSAIVLSIIPNVFIVLFGAIAGYISCCALLWISTRYRVPFWPLNRMHSSGAL